MKTLIKSSLIYFFVQLSLANLMPEFSPKDDVIVSVPEGTRTPVGSVIHKLKGIDYDGDILTFTIKGDPDKMFGVKRVSRHESNLVNLRELDREAASTYSLTVSLTDGRTSKPATQHILIIVMDANDSKFEANTLLYTNEHFLYPKVNLSFICLFYRFSGISGAG